MESAGELPKRKKREGINLFPSYDYNPSVKKKLSGIYIGKNVVDTDKLKVISEDGVVMEDYMVISDGSRTIRDSKPFLKVYAEALEGMPKLTGGGMRLLIYLWQRIPANVDLIYLDVEDAKRVCGYENIASIYKAIIDLVKNGFIYRAIGDQRYYINVEMFFNGKRVLLEPLKRLQERLDNANQ